MAQIGNVNASDADEEVLGQHSGPLDQAVLDDLCGNIFISLL